MPTKTLPPEAPCRPQRPHDAVDTTAAATRQDDDDRRAGAQGTREVLGGLPGTLGGRTARGAAAASPNQISLKPLNTARLARPDAASPTPKIVIGCQRLDGARTSQPRPAHRAAIATIRIPVPGMTPRDPIDRIESLLARGPIDQIEEAEATGSRGAGQDHQVALQQPNTDDASATTARRPPSLPADEPDERHQQDARKGRGGRADLAPRQGRPQGLQQPTTSQRSGAPTARGQQVGEDDR